MQPNGLPDIIKRKDWIPSPDWCRPETWVTPEDSTFIMRPSEGEVLEVTGAKVDFSQAAVFHAGGEMEIRCEVAGAIIPTPIRIYYSKADFLHRAVRYEESLFTGTVGGDITGPVMSLWLEFEPTIILWTSTGLYYPYGPQFAAGPKLNALSIKIADDIKYRKADGTDAEMARVSYYANVYKDPDYEVPE